MEKNMKKNCCLVVILFTSILLYTNAFAHGGEDEHAAHDHHSEKVTTVNEKDLLKKLNSEYQALVKTIELKDLAPIHEASETISSLAVKLMSSVSEDKKAKITGLANNLKSISAELHSNADKNDQKAVEISIKKMGSIVSLLNTRLGFEAQANNHDEHHNHHAATCSAPDVTIAMLAKQFAFEPAVVTVKKNQKVCLKLSSKDVEHGILIDGYNVHVHATIDNPGEVQFVADKVGEFNFICHQVCGVGHGEMKGKLVVE